MNDATHRARLRLIRRAERALIGIGFDMGKTEQARTFPETQREELETRLKALLDELGAKSS